MRFNRGSPFNCSQNLPNSQWDPDVVLGLTNENIDNDSCLGWAKTRGRRCERWIAGHKTKYGHDILYRLACDSPSKAAESPKLHDAAEILLCWRHANQISDILKQWKRKLEKWADDTESKGKSCVKVEAVEDLLGARLRQMQEEMRRRSSNYASEKPAPPRNFKQEEEDDLARERKRREKEKQKQKEEEEKERQRKEEEKRRKQKAREEAFRERVRLAKERREREAREKAKKEAASWRTAWERYSKAWSKPADVSVTDIPWPVRSGLQSDVNEANVKLFFAKAPPADLVDSGDKRFKLISEENKRWHTDKVMQRFGSDAVNGAAKGPLGIVAKVVIELRQEARKGI